MYFIKEKRSWGNCSMKKIIVWNSGVLRSLWVLKKFNSWNERTMLSIMKRFMSFQSSCNLSRLVKSGCGYANLIFKKKIIRGMKIYYWTFETQYILLFYILTSSLVIIYIYIYIYIYISDWKLGILFLTQIANSFFFNRSKRLTSFFHVKRSAYYYYYIVFTETMFYLTKHFNTWVQILLRYLSMTEKIF